MYSLACQGRGTVGDLDLFVVVVFESCELHCDTSTTTTTVDYQSFLVRLPNRALDKLVVKQSARDRQTDRDRETDRQTDTQRQRQTERQRQRERQREGEREREPHKIFIIRCFDTTQSSLHGQTNLALFSVVPTD